MTSTSLDVSADAMSTMGSTASATAVQQPIRFWFQDRLVAVHQAEPTRTVLDWLREDSRATGTKEGCNEGECGACTVVIGELCDSASNGPVGSSATPRLQLRPMNACIRFLPTLHGKALFTVEDLKSIAGDRLHPVQQAMVDHHGSQCGFCTPGFVMSLWSTFERHCSAGTRPDRQQLADDLSGNLCRCTGYRPIIDAGEAMFDAPRVALDAAPVISALAEVARERLGETFVHAAADGQSRYHAPTTVAGLAALRNRLPAARLVAGSTDVGLWVTKQFKALGDVIHTGDIAELREIRVEDGAGQRVSSGDGHAAISANQAGKPVRPASTGQVLVIGAAASLEDAWAALAARFEGLTEVWLRFAGLPVRHAGTMGGNVANGSPIGDAPPVLLALDASIVLRHGQARRTIPLAAFYLDYMKSDLREGEFLESIRVPLDDGLTVRAYKISKRYDCDITAVLGAFALRLDRAGVVTEARLAWGGMAAIAKRAAATEAALVGLPFDRPALDAARAALATDFTPLTDMRASAAHRLRVARNLLERLWLETRATDPLPTAATRVFVREAS